MLLFHLDIITATLSVLYQPLDEESRSWFWSPNAEIFDSGSTEGYCSFGCLLDPQCGFHQSKMRPGNYLVAAYTHRLARTGRKSHKPVSLHGDIVSITNSGSAPELRRAQELAKRIIISDSNLAGDP